MTTLARILEDRERVRRRQREEAEAERVRLEAEAEVAPAPEEIPSEPVPPRPPEGPPELPTGEAYDALSPEERLKVDQEQALRIEQFGPSGRPPTPEEQAQTQQQQNDQLVEAGRIIAAHYPDLVPPGGQLVTPESAVTSIQNLQARVNENPDAFAEELFQRGRTPDTVFILDLFGVDTPEEVDAFFQGAPEPKAEFTPEAQAIQRVFPNRTLDASLELANTDRPAFLEEIRSQGITADTWELLKVLYPGVSTADRVLFFAAEPPSMPDNVFLNAIGTGLQFANGWWQIANMEMGFGLYKALETLRGDTSHWTSDAEKMLDAAFQKYGWRAIYSGEVQAAWDTYFIERDMPGPVQFVADMGNPIWFIPIGGALGRLSLPLLKVPALGPSLARVTTGVARGVSFLEAAPVAIPLAGARATARGVAALTRVAVGTPTLTPGVRAAGKFLLREIPDADTLRSWLFQSDSFQKIASHVPLLGRIAPSTVIGELPLTLATKEEITQAVTQEVIMHRTVRDMGQADKGQALAYLRELGTTKEIYGVGKDALASPKRVIPKTPGGSLALGDIIQAPEQYTFTHANGLLYAKRAQQVTQEMYERAVAQGVEVKTVGLEPFQEYIHWVVTGKVGKDGVVEETRRGAGRAVGGNGSSFKTRRFESQLEGIQQGYQYADDVEVYVASYFDDMWKAIADKRLGDGLGKVMARIDGALPTTPLERLNALYPGVEIAWTGIKKEMADLGYALGATRRASRGEALPGATMRALRQRFPQAADRLDFALSLSERDIDRELGRFADELWASLKTTPKQFKDTLAQLRGQKIDAQHPVRAGEIDDTLRAMNADARIALKMQKQIYRDTEAFRTALLKDMVGDLSRQIDTLRPEWWKARAVRAEKLEIARGPLLGQGEGRIVTAQGRPHPMFQNQVYPEAIATQASKLLNDEANAALKTMAAIGAGLRIPIASIDLSFAAIQLLIAQASPITAKAAAAATIRGVQAFIKPIVLQRYLVEHAPSINEFLFYLGTQRDFEYFEAFGWISKLGDKIPGGRFVIGQTYGRGQAAFTMASIVFRDMMWRSTSQAFIRGGEGAAYARLLDRMRGTMSFNRLGMPANVSAVATGWVSFAPQYTVAVMGHFAEMFKGGMTGAFARKQIATAIGAGIIAYVVFTKALGRPTYLNPVTDGKKFLSIEVNGQWVGLGSKVISLIRASGDIAASALSIDENEPMDFLTLDKWKNPILRAYFVQAAVLPGLITQVVQQRDFLGYPIEGPEEWASWLAQRFTPISAQSVLFDKSGVPPTALSTLGNIIGLRASPESRWEQLDDRTRKLKAWEVVTGLTEDQKKRIEKGDTILSVLDRFQKIEMFNAFPELTPLYEQAASDALLRASEPFKNYEQATLNIRKEVVDALTKAIDVGVGDEGKDTKWLRQRNGDVMNVYGAKNDLLRDVEEYQPIFAEWEQNKEKRKPDAMVIDLAYWDYIEKVASPDYETPSGDFDFDAYNKSLAAFRAEWGEEVYQKILFILKEKKSDLPVWHVRLWENRLALGDAGYWDLPYQALRLMTQKDLDQGNVPAEYIGLVQGFLAAKSNAERDALLVANPTLDQEFRTQLRLKNPKLDAMLALWGYGGKLQSLEAYNLVEQWGKELGIPLEQMGLGLPPREHLDNYFALNKIVAETSGNSPEARLFKLEHPDYFAWGLGQGIWTDDLKDTSLPALRIQVKYGNEFTAYEAFGNQDESSYVKDEKARAEARAAFLASNPEFAKARREREGYELGLPDALVPQYVDYTALPGGGYRRDRYLLAHPGLYRELVDKKQLRPFDKGYRVPDVAYDDISEKYADLFKAYEAEGLTEQEAVKVREGIKAGNPEFALARQRRNAYAIYFPAEQVDSYAEYYNLLDQGKPEGWSRWWTDDRYLKEHPEFYQALKGNLDAWGDDDRDFDAIPSEEFERLYNTVYINLRLPNGTADRRARDKMRATNKEFDLQGVIAGLWQPYYPTPRQEIADLARRLATR